MQTAPIRPLEQFKAWFAEASSEPESSLVPENSIVASRRQGHRLSQQLHLAEDPRGDGVGVHLLGAYNARERSLHNSKCGTADNFKSLPSSDMLEHGGIGPKEVVSTSKGLLVGFAWRYMNTSGILLTLSCVISIQSTGPASGYYRLTRPNSKDAQCAHQADARKRDKSVQGGYTLTSRINAGLSS
ncbi:uncharacterized protein ARMOST_13958 [Armillaria ostoyae]|uniref:Uncharacterized protein n=1 Tax=Armillaria ostoyae TaxID=47428 RepID=A0A284RP81_ARMOS|nr:uncharacterized protein ARMOST_13958 [Armillaria ostoyae]